jgi:2-dehydropantoate 2-reductase
MIRIGMIGAGAMGGVFAAAFARAGKDVTLFDSNTAHVAAIATRGLRIDRADGSHAIHRLPAHSDAAALGALDVGIVLVDSANTRAAAEILAGCLKPDGFALTLQNGIGNVETLREVLGEARVVAGSTYVSAAFVEPGRILHSNTGETVMGECGGQAGARAPALAEALTRAGLPTRALDGVMGHIWMKFALNCAINPICAATGLRPGEIAREPHARRLLDAAIDEILAVAAAAKIALPCADPRREIVEHALVRYNRPSMLQHVEAGRVPEIPALNGALVAAGARLGVSTPTHSALADIVMALAARVRARKQTPDLDETALEAAARA